MIKNNKQTTNNALNLYQKPKLKVIEIEAESIIASSPTTNEGFTEDDPLEWPVQNGVKIQILDL